jgi:hypothetical protein
LSQLRRCSEARGDSQQFTMHRTAPFLTHIKGRISHPKMSTVCRLRNPGRGL